MNEKKLFLLDAFALIFRAYYAFINNPMRNSKGMNTSAIFGFINVLDEIIKKEKPTHIAVAFDTPAPTFRDKLFEKYKGQRPPAPEDIKIATPIIKQIIKAFNIPVLECDGWEADDVVGTLAKKAEANGFKTFMMTTDKDYCQLVSDNIFIYKPKRSGNDVEILDVGFVCKEFNITNPLQVIDVLGLWGDTADNVPGCPGIGEKSSKEIIGKYGSIENVYNNIDAFKGKQKENLIQFREQIELSRTLVTIDLNVPVEFDEEKLKLTEPNFDELKKIFDELEFRTLAARIIKTNEAKPVVVVKNEQGSLFDQEAVLTTSTPVQNPSLKNISTNAHEYFLIDTPDKRKKLIEQLSTVAEFCFDTETTGLDTLTADLVGMSFAIKANEAYYIPIPPSKDEAQKIVDEFKPVFENASIKKVGQNVKFDYMMLLNYDVHLQGQVFDTMLAHYLLQPESRHNLDLLAETLLQYQMVSIEELIGKKGKPQGNMRNVAVEQIKEYAAEDADVALQIKILLEPKIIRNHLQKLMDEMEVPLIYVLADMERTGVALNTDALKLFSKELQTEIASIEKEIIEMAGFNFNVASPKQLGEILFERLKIVDNPKMTKTKQYATGEDELLKLKDKHPIIGKILDFRSLTKLLSTYVDSLPELINSKTGRIHTSYNQAVASTGRLSSNNPNLQNIPIKTEKGREIRKAFVPTEGNLILSADYSQIELRIMAHVSKDKNMILAFKNNEDIHTATAANIFKVEAKDVTREMRGQAKGANFGIIYGISAFGLAENLHISRTDAKTLIDNYFATYPNVKAYMDDRIKFARLNMFVPTLFGRKRWLHDIHSTNQMVKGIAERNAINSPIQGSAADIIKMAMINIFKIFNEKQLRSKMILQVHDELVFDVVPAELEQVKEIVKYEMENAIQLEVPLTVEMGVGHNWLEAH